jgi:hypothetical protein
MITGSGRADSLSGASDDARPDPLDDRPATDTRSGSDHPPKPLVLSSGPLRDVARGLVMGLGEVAHHFLARSDDEQDAGLWKFEDQDDAGEIADPATSIVERHLGTARVPADLADAVAMIVAAGGYALRNGLEALKLRRNQRAMIRAGMQPADPEE